MSDLTDEDLLAALDRIARTPDGELLYLYFQRVQMELPADPNPSGGALRHLNGRRSLAAELMGRMAKGMDESGGRSASSERTNGRPVVFRTGKPAVANRRVSPRAWLAATDAELTALTVNKPDDAG